MTMTSIRRLHNWIGLFVAPSVLFFALTGALQLFSLHEAHSDYRPPAMVEKLSSLHKDQEFAFGKHHSPPQAQNDSDKTSAAETAQDGEHSDASTMMLKYFFLLVALGLTLSTSFGIWMGLRQSRRKGLAWLLLVAGAILPVVLLLS